jgi:hypothetical protein
MTDPIDPRTSWWWWRQVQNRLIKWTLALLAGRKYTVRLADEGSAYQDPVHHIIQANPQLFPEEEVPLQFRCTQGLLAHEVGHALFSSSWPDQQENILRELANILEDQRIENAISVFYPGVASVIHALNAEMWKNVKPFSMEQDPAQAAFRCCLYWRWAREHLEAGAFPTHMRMDRAARERWEKVRPLVEEAWRAPDTIRVIELARQVLAILEMSVSNRSLGLGGISPNGIPEQRDSEHPALPFPKHSAAKPGPGTGLLGLETPPARQDDFSRPAPYTDLENETRPAATVLAESLQHPQPDTRPMPHEWRGRYSFRQENRTLETPNLDRQGVGNSSRNTALYLLVDRSGSMCSLQEQVRRALMTIYLAAMQLEIPTGVGCFGADYVCPSTTFPICGLGDPAREETKALIAGFTGETSYEFLNWGLDLAEKEFRARPERRKLLIVMHDGQPVWRKDKPGSDWNLSFSHLRGLERQGVTPIGVYLGNDPTELAQCKSLFPHLVESSGDQLPEDLGKLLRGLV